jgi:hypothetical protein
MARFTREDIIDADLLSANRRAAHFSAVRAVAVRYRRANHRCSDPDCWPRENCSGDSTSRYVSNRQMRPHAASIVAIRRLDAAADVLHSAAGWAVCLKKVAVRSLGVRRSAVVLVDPGAHLKAVAVRSPDARRPVVVLAAYQPVCPAERDEPGGPDRVDAAAEPVADGSREFAAAATVRRFELSNIATGSSNVPSPSTSPTTRMNSPPPRR